MDYRSDSFVRAARLNDVRAAGRVSVRVAGRSLALFFHDGRVYAVDNRCPHMGFPLHRGTVRDGILTCHWHHARFDLQSGGTFDQFADEARVFPVEIRNGEVWVDAAGELVARYLHGGGDADRLLAVMGGLLLREDRNFHTIQAVEAAFRQYALLHGTAAGTHVLIAAARYLAAHSPTMRSQGQTYDIARRLSRGEILHEE